MITNPLVHFLVGGTATSLIAYLGNSGYTTLGGALGAMPILDLIPILFITVSATAAANTAKANAIVHIGTIIAMLVMYCTITFYQLSTTASAFVALCIWFIFATIYILFKHIVK
jgi:uncharacterized membrane protein (GlpM family)